jgi:hypothetical protein
VCVLLCDVLLCVQRDCACMGEVSAYQSGVSDYKSRLGCLWVSWVPTGLKIAGPSSSGGQHGRGLGIPAGFER